MLDILTGSGTWGQVVGDEVVRHVSPQPHLEARHAEVAELPVVEDEVAGAQLDDVYFVVKHNRVGCLRKSAI